MHAIEAVENKRPAEKPDSMRVKIRAAQIRQLHAQSRLATLAASVLALILVVTLRSAVSGLYLMTWAFVYVLLQIGRYGLIAYFHRIGHDDAATIEWGKWFAMGTVPAGLMWGMAGMLFFANDAPLYQFLLSLFVAGIASSAALVYSPVVEVCFPTLVASLVPLSLRFVYEGGEFNLTVGMIIILFMMVLMVTARRMNSSYTESLRLRFENTDLIDSLTRQKSMAEDLNESLTREIEERKLAEEARQLEKDKFQILCEHAPFGMAMMAEDGSFLHINPKFVDLFGYTLDEIPEARARFEAACANPAQRKDIVNEGISDLHSTKPGELRTRTCTVLCKNGREKIVDFRTVQISTGEHLMTCEDVTRRRLADKVLQEAQLHLERRVQERTAQLSRANAILEQEVADRTRAEEALRKARDELEQRVSERTAQLQKINRELSFEVSERAAAEERLTKSEARHKALLAAIPDPVIVYDPQGRATYVNPAFTATYGWSQEEALGKIIDFVPPEELTATQETWLHTILGEKNLLETRRLTKAGEILDVQVRTAILLDNAGTHSESIVIHHDITSLRRAEEELRKSEKKFRSLFESAPDMIHILDTEGRILQSNPAALRTFGFDEKDLLGRSVTTLLGAESGAAFELHNSSLIASSVCRHELDIVGKGGVTLTLDCSASPILDEKGEVRSVVVFQRDITEKKRVLLAAEDAAAKLEKSLANATKLRVQADAANRAKSEFLATMSHELRTPLNAVIGFSEILEDQTFGEMNEKQLKFIGHVLSSGRHLLELINDILDLSKIESGKDELQLSAVNLSKLLTDSLVMIKEKARIQGLALDVAVQDDIRSASILADEIKIKRVMSNLLSNAVKFTPGGGTIRIQLDRNDDELVVRVSDTGIGLSRENYDRIFGAFEQVDSTFARRQQGTGLGLALTRRLVELQGGRIRVDSGGLGKGSTFTFTIPWVESHASVPAAKEYLSSGYGDSTASPEDSVIHFEIFKPRH